MSLASAYPDVAAEWHPDLNTGPGPSEVTPYANVSAWWLGSCGHEWEARVANRTARGSGCPFCARRAVLRGFNDLATTHPALVAQWHPRNEYQPHTIQAGSVRPALWVGECGHVWTATVKARALQGSACPFCAGKAVLSGFNDLATTHPALAAQWHPTKNGDLTVEQVSAGSKKPAWWTAECGHTWRARPNTRTSNGSLSCSICTGHQVQVGVNDLATTHPGLAAQWHPTNNGNLTADQVTRGSAALVWWLRAECGHEWTARVYDRSGEKQTSCPHCTHRVSRGEHAVAEFIEGLGLDVVRNSRELGFEIDLLVPRDGARTLAVEFNGVFWHSERFQDRDYHARKRDRILAAGMDYFAVWEDDWRDRRRVVEQALIHRLGLAGATRLGARSLTVCEVTRVDAERFLDANHLQGSAPRPCRHFGLRTSTGELVAVLSIRARGAAQPGVWEIVRYATSRVVSGGFSKILAAAERDIPDVVEWVTFADHAVSDGGLYLATGFTAAGVLPPDYSYVGNRNGWRREHKFNYRRSRFRDDQTLTYREDASERELADENGLLRLWDHGKTRFVRTVPGITPPP